MQINKEKIKRFLIEIRYALAKLMILNKSITSLIQPNNTKLEHTGNPIHVMHSSQFIVLNVGPPKIHIYVTNYL